MASLSDVALEAGVSKSVASRVLSGDTEARVSDATRHRIVEVANRLHYAPNSRSRALRFARSDALALVVPDVNNAVFSELLAGVEEVAGAQGSAVLLGQMTAPGTDRGTLASLVGKGRVDGIILQRREDANDEQLRKSMVSDVPVVLFNSVLPGRPGSVILDDERGATLAVEHLLELGHSRIAYIGGQSTHDAARRRRDGFERAMERAGLTATASIEAGWEATAGATAMADLLSAPLQPTALVVASVNAAIGATSAAIEHGLRIPEDLSVVTIHDSWVARHYAPPISVVEMPLREAGRRAAGMLLNHLHKGDALLDEMVTHPAPRVVHRRSTTAL